MIVDVRDWGAEGYKRFSSYGAIRAVLNTLDPMGSEVVIGKMIDLSGATVPPEWIVNMAQKTAGTNETFLFAIDGASVKVKRLEDVEREEPPKPPRKHWPMRDMKVGDVIEIKVGQYGKANPQTYVHVYGRQSGMRFKTTRKEAAFIVERIY